MVDATPSSADLRRLMQRLFRRFGALSSDRTPCGKPLPMGYAHGLMVLLGGGAMSQQELGRELCIDKSNVARLCAKMAEAGHVVQRADATDGRIRRISLTPKGEALAREVDAASGARFGDLLDALPRTRRASVVAALGDLVRAVEALPAADERNVS
jgi:DNA-binding MarR family transcriptional regulator